MTKNFDDWIIVKKKVDRLEKRPLFKQKEVWWCSIGSNVGDEQDGKGTRFVRPVLVLKKFNKNICWALPLSTKVKENPYYHKITFKGLAQCVVLSQIKIIDAKRFGDKMGEISEEDFKIVKQKISKIINT